MPWVRRTGEHATMDGSLSEKIKNARLHAGRAFWMNPGLDQFTGSDLRVFDSMNSLMISMR